MNQFSNLISEPILEALGWTFIHSIWQISIITIICYLLGKVISDTKANVRYISLVGGMITLVLSSILTFYLCYEPPVTPLVPTGFTVTGEVISTSYELRPLSIGIFDFYLHWINSNIVSIFIFWLVGFILFSSKLLIGFTQVFSLRKNCLPIVDEKILALIRKAKAKFGIARNIIIAESNGILSPSTFGCITPVILFPVGVINSLTINEIEAIIAHELSHIKRNDYIINIMQSIVETVFYFHPGIWWISNQIRIEREKCCDDMAVSVTNRKMQYAKALVKMQAFKLGTPRLALGFANKNNFLSRVQRILVPTTNKPRIIEKSISIMVLLALIVTVSIAAITPEHDFTIKSSEVNATNTSCTYYSENDNRRIEMKETNGEIEYLKVNEILIDKSVYHLYENEIADVQSNIDIEKINKKTKVENSTTTDSLTEFIRSELIDTIPDLDRIKTGDIMWYNHNNQRIDLDVEDGEIVKLWIDGKVIQKEAFSEFEKIIKESIAKSDEIYKKMLEIEIPSPPAAPPYPEVTPPNPPKDFETPPSPPSPPTLPSNLKDILEKENDLTQMLELEDQSITWFKIEEGDTVKLNFDKFMEEHMDLEFGESFDMDEFLKDKNYTIISKLPTHLTDLIDNIEKFDFSEFEELSSSQIKEMIALQNLGSDINVDLLESNKALKDIDELMIDQLLEDGLIENEASYKVKLTDKYLKINGQKFTGPIHEKYKKLFEEVLGTEFTKRSKYERNFDQGSKNQRTINI